MTITNKQSNFTRNVINFWMEILHITGSLRHQPDAVSLGLVSKRCPHNIVFTSNVYQSSNNILANDCVRVAQEHDQWKLFHIINDV